MHVDYMTSALINERVDEQDSTKSAIRETVLFLSQQLYK